MKTLGSLAVLVTALALASGAAASPPRHANYGTPEAWFEVSGTNGFRVSFLVSRALLLAAARSGPYEVQYVVKHPEVEGDRFTGSLPGIGGVSVRFHQRGPTRRQRSACRQDPPILTRQGDFVGTIHLRGEKGYTRIRTTHASGSVTLAGHSCPRLPPEDRFLES